MSIPATFRPPSTERYQCRNRPKQATSASNRSPARAVRKRADDEANIPVKSPTLTLRTIFLPLAFACALWGGETSASCGDYLHKRGTESNEAAATDQHDDPEECRQHQPVHVPIAPLPTNPLPQNDHFVQTAHSGAFGDGTQRQNRSNHTAVGRRGYLPRIDRPPQR